MKKLSDFIQPIPKAQTSKPATAGFEKIQTYQKHLAIQKEWVMEALADCNDSHIKPLAQEIDEISWSNQTLIITLLKPQFIHAFQFQSHYIKTQINQKMATHHNHPACKMVGNIRFKTPT